MIGKIEFHCKEHGLYGFYELGNVKKKYIIHLSYTILDHKIISQERSNGMEKNSWTSKEPIWATWMLEVSAILILGQ